MDKLTQDAEASDCATTSALERRLYSVQEVAESLSISTTMVRQLTHQVDLKGVTIGRRMLYRAESVDSFVESLCG